MTRRTRRLGAAVAASVVAGATGMVTGNPAVLLSSVVGLGYAAYARTGGVPDAEVRVDRAVNTTAPAPGEDVRVRLSVTNDGPRTVPDCRVADGVPDELSVVDGSPRAATALRPGESTTVEYAVRARRGEHAFGPVTVAVRGASGAAERVVERDPGTRLRCLAVAATSTPAAAGGLRAGRIATDEGGSGVEFHATRDYRPGDPMRRIDWNRLARTGELTTVEFRDERAASVVLAVDARSAVDRAPTPADPGAVDLAVHAAEQARRGLLADGHRVGLAVLGDAERDDATTGSGTDTGSGAGTSHLAWLAPDAGRVHRARLRAALEATRAGGVDPEAPVAAAMGVTQGHPSTADGSTGGDDVGATAAGHDRPLIDEERPLEHLFGAQVASSPDDDPDDPDEDADGANGRDDDGGESDARTSPDAGSDAGPERRASTDGGLPDDWRSTGAVSGGRPETADGTDAAARVAALRRRVAAEGEAHVLLVSPAIDELPRAIVAGLGAVGHPVSVVSPDVTASDSAGEKLAGMERADRLRALRRGGAGVGDWTPGEPVALALMQAISGVQPAAAGDGGGTGRWSA